MTLEFSEKQKEVWRNTINARHRWNVSLGATRSGKTYLDYFKIPYRIRSAPNNGLILLLGNTKGTLERNILEPMRQIWTSGLVGNIGSDNKVNLFGRECYALGADKVNQVSKLQGSGLAYCYGDEVTTWNQDVFQMLKSRLDKPGACFDGTCNPDNPNHWFKAFLDSDADIYQMSFTIDDNPFLEARFVQSLKQEYAGTVYYDRYILGHWAIANGLIYSFFADNPEKYLYAGQTTGLSGAFYVSIDYGTHNPCSMGLWCVEHNRAIRIDESYYDSRKELKQRTDEEHYAELERLTSGRYIQYVVVDPSAASFIETIRRHGKFQVLAANNDVLNGIRTTAALMNAGKLLIHKSCKSSIREFQSYCWDDDAKEDKVIKENDHAMDDIRYFANTILAREYKWADWKGVQ